MRLTWLLKPTLLSVASCALALAGLPAALAAADSADSGATNVPDPYGLGERLALIDDLHNRAITVPEKAELEELRKLYRDSLDTTKADTAARHEALVRRLWVDYHQNAPDHATNDELAALIETAQKRQQSADAAERKRQQDDAVAAAGTPAHPAPSQPAPASADPPTPGVRETPPTEPADGSPAVGAPFPAFTGTTVTGQAISLKDYRGKVVLVDFWATWCGPCVGEMPNVIATYGKYHDQGFDIIGVSLDQDKDRLEQFLSQQNVRWQIIFDGAGWGNAVARQFNIHSIPNTWLIGKDGKLIAQGLRGEALGPAIAQALKAP